MRASPLSDLRPRRRPITRTVTVLARNNELTERVRAELVEQGLRPIDGVPGHNAAMIFHSHVVSREQTCYTEGWALEDPDYPFTFPRWHAWATVRQDGTDHVVDITPGWFDRRHALYAPLYTYGIAEALDRGILPIHGDRLHWMHHPMDWPNAPGGTIQVTSFEPDAA